MDVLASFATNDDIRMAVNLANCLVSLIFAFILISFQSSLLTKELWARFLCFFFLIMGLLYGVRFVATFWDTPTLVDIAGAVGSAINNIFVMATALALLDAKLIKRKGREISGFFPPWNWVLAIFGMVLGLIGIYLQSKALGYRLVDALVSAFYIGLLGFSLFLNINGGHLVPVFKSKSVGFLGSAVLISQIFYGGVQVLFAFSGYFASEKAEQFEGFLFAVSLPLKSILFAGGLLLLIQSVTLTHAREIRKALKKFREHRS